MSAENFRTTTEARSALFADGGRSAGGLGSSRRGQVAPLRILPESTGAVIHGVPY
jgi:hypothetical protein